MESVKMVKGKTLEEKWRMQRTEWFGFSGELTRGMDVAGYLSGRKKNKSDVEKTTEEHKRLEKAHKYARLKVESNKALAQSIEMHKKEILYYTQEIERVRKEQELINSKALKIQKVARGYLARKGLETVAFT
jgi:hypothetical protein